MSLPVPNSRYLLVGIVICLMATALAPRPAAAFSSVSELVGLSICPALNVILPWPITCTKPLSVGSFGESQTVPTTDGAFVVSAAFSIAPTSTPTVAGEAISSISVELASGSRLASVRADQVAVRSSVYSPATAVQVRILETLLRVLEREQASVPTQKLPVDATTYVTRAEVFDVVHKQAYRIYDQINDTENTSSPLGTSIDSSEIIDGSVTEADLLLNTPTDGYVLQASSSSAGGFVWVATSTLGISGGGGASVSFGADNQIPFSNSDGDDFDYSNLFTFDGTTLTAPTSSFSGQLSLAGTAANLALGSNWLSGDGDDEGLYVAADGKVGIGTTSVTAALEVVGDVRVGEVTNDSLFFIDDTVDQVFIGQDTVSGVARFNVGNTSPDDFFDAGDTDYGNVNFSLYETVGAGDNDIINLTLKTLVEPTSNNSSSIIGLANYTSHLLNSSSTGSVIGVWNETYSRSENSSVYGAYSYTEHVATTSTLYGNSVESYITGGTVTGNTYGGNYNLDISSGAAVATTTALRGVQRIAGVSTADSVVGVLGELTVTGAGSSVTEAVVFDGSLTESSGGSVTTAYGLRLGDLDGTTAYGVYQSGTDDINVFLGDVGIGTTSPVSLLTIAGTTTPADDNQYSLGNSSYRWSAVYAADGAINTSDARLKDNITMLTYGLDDVLQLKPVSFIWKDNPGRGDRFGLIAQDVQLVIPEVVEEGSDANNTLGIRYTELTAVLINAIQELWQTITLHDERLAALETENQALAERLAALEKGEQSESFDTSTSEQKGRPDSQSETSDREQNYETEEVPIGSVATSTASSSKETASTTGAQLVSINQPQPTTENASTTASTEVADQEDDTVTPEAAEQSSFEIEQPITVEVQTYEAESVVEQVSSETQLSSDDAADTNSDEVDE